MHRRKIDLLFQTWTQVPLELIQALSLSRLNGLLNCFDDTNVGQSLFSVWLRNFSLLNAIRKVLRLRTKLVRLALADINDLSRLDDFFRKLSGKKPS
jgi:hypothetical protein